MREADHGLVRRKIQIIGAVSAGVAGIGGLGFALFTPLHVTQECFATAGGDGAVCRHSLSSLFDDSGFAALGGMLIPALVFAVVAIAGVLNARTPSATSRRVLWLSMAIVAALTFALIFSLGPFMLPGTLLSAYTALLARNGDAPAKKTSAHASPVSA
jgi:cytochrome bd-type quinol oxidase subunit 2